MVNYEIIEHTADIGIKVKGKNLKDLFRNTALAMFDIMAQTRLQTKGHKLQVKKNNIELKAQNLDELFVNWLNELLSLSATKNLIFNDFEIDKLDENSLQATALGCDIKRYKVNTEIKAATYHELDIKKTKTNWQAQVIFDV